VNARAMILLTALALAGAGCGSGEQATRRVPAQTLDFAIDAHRMATDTASAARAALERSGAPAELSLRSADLQADTAELEERVREEHPTDARTHAPLLAAADALLASTQGLAGTIRAPTATSAAGLRSQLDAVERGLRQVADTIDPELPADRRTDIAKIRRSLPRVVARPR
jgi:methylmalonyl-CoA mutase cobalamin-binding subunit